MQFKFDVNRIIDNLPENLSYEYRDNTHYIVAAEYIQSNFTWGPFPIASNSGTKWSSLEMEHAEWIMALIYISNKYFVEKDATNIKLNFDKINSTISLTTKMDIAKHSELRAELIINQSKEDEQIHQKSEQQNNNTDNSLDNNSANDSSSSNNNPGGKSAVPSGNKPCKYCGISFSQQGTLDAHINYYCSGRKSDANNNCNTKLVASGTATNTSVINCNGNGGGPTTNNNAANPTADTNALGANPQPPGIINNNPVIMRHQKNWRTRQRRQSTNTTPKFNVDAFAALSQANLFNSGGPHDDDPNNKSKFIEPAAAAAILASLSNIFSASNTPAKSTFNCSSTGNVSTPGSAANKQSNPPASACIDMQPTLPLSNVPTHHQQSQHQHHSNNTSSHEHNGLYFCKQCELFFASAELYSIHMRLDITTMKSSHLNSLVLAAPVVSNNSTAVQYIPVHPRTSMLPNNYQHHHQQQQHPLYNNKSPTARREEAIPANSNNNASLPLDLSISSSTSNVQQPVVSPNSMVLTKENIDTLVAIAARLNTTTQSSMPTSSSNTAAPTSTATQTPGGEPPRRYKCQNCQTAFQLYQTFQAHQQFYCHGNPANSANNNASGANTSGPNNNGPHPITSVKRKFNECHNNTSISPDKRSRINSTDINAAGINTDSSSSSRQSNDESNPEYFESINQGFRCLACGFIGQTKRGIRIHIKNQCYKNKISTVPTGTTLACHYSNSRSPDPDLKSEEIDVVCSSPTSAPSTIHPWAKQHNHAVKVKIEPNSSHQDSNNNVGSAGEDDEEDEDDNNHHHHHLRSPPVVLGSTINKQCMTSASSTSLGGASHSNSHSSDGFIEVDHIK